MTPTDALSRALIDVVDRLNDSVPGPKAHPESGELLRIALAIEQAAEAADGVTRGSLAAPPPSAAADLDPEALAHAMLASGIRCEPEYPTTLDAARVLAAAYAAAREAADRIQRRKGAGS